MDNESHSKTLGRVSFLLMVLAVAAVALVRAGSIASAEGSGPAAAPATSLGTAFTYQGQLYLNGSPVNATCAMTFKLFDAVTGGNQLGGVVTPSVVVTGGLFNAQLDFGGQFTGDRRWLDIAVNCGSGLAQLSPRQELTAAPYASGLMPGARIIAADVGLNVDSLTDLPGGDACLLVEVTSNRPDCLGHIGVARELAAAIGSKVKLPDAACEE